MIKFGNKRIIGNGLIANSLCDIIFHKNILVLASGVSNSKETRASEFKREADLVSDEMSRYPQHHVIYFSTCSLENGVSTPYTRHKLQMELLVSDSSASFHIFRLPQVVGLVSNSTLVSFFVDSILKNKVLNVERYATRNLFDVSDVARIVEMLVNHELGGNSTQNIASTNNLPVMEIAEEICILLDRKPNVVLTSSGNKQVVNVDFLKTVLNSNDVIFSNDYWRLVLKKYVPLYLNIFNSASS